MTARELSKFEQDTLIEALTQIDSANKAKKIAEYAAAIETEKSGRLTAEAKVGELQAELVKRGDGYRSSLKEEVTRREQAVEARMTADILSAQYKAEAQTERENFARLEDKVKELTDTCAAMFEQMQGMTMDEPALEDAPVSYRLEVVGRDAAGDLRTVDIIPVERK